MINEDKLVEEWLDERYLKDMGVRKPCKEAYLAGFKAAKQEKWHNLQKNHKDLPDACANIINQDGEKVRYDYVNEVWRYDDANDYICDTPIAWCEVTTFEE